MTRKNLIDRILEIARREGADELLEMTAASLHADLYELAASEFGGWDAALAVALTQVVRDQATSTPGAGRSTDQEEPVERVVGEAAGHPIFTITGNGAFYRTPAADLPLTPRPIIPATPHSAGRIRRLAHLGEPSGVVVFTDKGRYFGLDARMVPNWDGEMLDRRVQDVLHLDADERIIDVVERRALYGGRMIHITAQAKGKASLASDMSYTLDREPREAFLLQDDDQPVAAMVGPEANSVFCASAMGKAIHFDASDIRSMGLKAVGVNVMKLQDERDAIVGAFLGAGVEQVALITEEGLGKRVDFDEFRQQGRAGAGLQLLRLDGSDRVAACVACEAGGDLVVITDRGRLHRTPATDFARMGRPAKGNRQIELVDDEKVVALSALPAGG